MSQVNPSARNQEREALVAEIIEKIRQDELIKDVLKEPERDSLKDSLLELFKHPAILVLLTFACTGIIGSRLTSFWQGRQKALEEKYQIADQLGRSFAEYAAAAEDILSLYAYEENAKNRDELEKERWTYWQQKSREWRINANILLQKLKTNFTDPATKKSFEESKETLYQVSVSIKNLKGGVDAKGWDALKQQDFIDENRRILRAINDSKTKISGLLDLMMNEIRNE